MGVRISWLMPARNEDLRLAMARGLALRLFGLTL